MSIRGLVRRSSANRPNVIVEFDVDRDVLFVVVRNIGVLPAAHVRIAFDPAFHGLGGAVEIPRLALFRRLDFLGPAREIRALVDPLHAWLGREKPAEPRVIGVRIAYRDGAGRRYRARLRHDLGVWEDLPRLAVPQRTLPQPGIVNG